MSRMQPSAVLPVGWLTLFVVVPMTALLSSHVVIPDVTRVFSRGSTWDIVWFSTWQAFASVMLTFIVAMPITWIVGRYHFRGRLIVRAVASIGFLLPSIVVSAGFLALLPDAMDISLVAILGAHAYFNVAVVLRIVAPRLESLDTQLMWAARSLGATRVQAMSSIWWPAMRGAVTSAAGVIFIYCFSSYAIVRTLGGPTRNSLESDIALRAYAVGDIGGAVVLSLLQLAVIGAVLVIGRIITRDIRVGARRTRMTSSTLVGGRRAAAGCIIVVTISGVLAPLISLATRSFRVGERWSLSGWRAVFSGDVVGSTSPLQSLWSSARTAAIAGVIGVLLSTLMSHAITRLRGSGRWLDVISMAPLAISPVTLGLGLIVTFDTGWYDWRGEWWFVAVVHSIVAFPLAVRVMVPSWRAISPGLRDAAAVLGASPLRRLFNIELRLIWSSIIAASGLIAAVSLGEFGAASMLSRSGAETLPVAISRLLARTGDTVRAQAFALATLLVIACLTVLLIIDVVGSRSRVSHRGAHARGQ